LHTDTLSEVLQAVRLRGAVFFDVEASAPWVAEAPPARVIAPAVMPGAGHVIEYHVLTGGTCWVSIPGSPEQVQLVAGDVVALPQGDAHVISSAPGMRGALDLSIFDAPGGLRLPLVMNLDGGGEEQAQLICGFLGCDARPFNPLLQSLPRLLHVPRPPDAAGPADAFIRMALAESREKRIGAVGMLSRLGELMFAELVRRHLEQLPQDSGGWLAGLRDRHVGRALALLHAEPQRDWTLEQLAREAGLSRSAFAARFTGFVGLAPMQYLKRWRLQLAAAQLADGMDSIAEIGTRAGYESEAAFSRAFRSAVGVPPGEWRRQSRPERAV
jgi:AraC-like DNA-binding protein